MNLWRKISSWDANPIVRKVLLALGLMLMIVSPVVGAIPGPGGVFVFAAGLSLVLRYSGWAKRRYVRFKQSNPNKGRWADWGLRRASARRRAEIEQQRVATGEPTLPPEIDEMARPL